MSKDVMSKIRAGDVWKHMERVLREYGLRQGRDFEVFDERPHPRIVVRHSGQERELPFACTPSSRSTPRVTADRLRKMLREMQMAALAPQPAVPTLLITKAVTFRGVEIDTVETIRRIVTTRRWRIEDEVRLHVVMAAEFQNAGLPVEREVRLSERDRIDFKIRSIGIEVKVKGSKRNIYKQIERYAQCGHLSHIILVTNVPIGLPTDIAGVPVERIMLTGALA